MYPQLSMPSDNKGVTVIKRIKTDKNKYLVLSLLSAFILLITVTPWFWLGWTTGAIECQMGRNFV
jgi:hypothetical protein